MIPICQSGPSLRIKTQRDSYLKANYRRAARSLLASLSMVGASACSDPPLPLVDLCPESGVCDADVSNPGRPDGGHLPDGAVLLDSGPIRPDGGVGMYDTGSPDSGTIGRDGGSASDTGTRGLTEVCGINPVTVDDYEDCRFQRFCEFLVRCDAFGSYSSVSDCLENHDDSTFGSIGYIRNALKEASAAGRVSLNSDAFEGCVRRLADDSTCYSGGYPDCLARWTGNVPNGGACQIDMECSPEGSRCIRDCSDQCCTGVCRASAQLAEQCGVEQPCAAGLHCSPVDGSFQCISGDIGTPCYSVIDCDIDSWCQDGTCVPDLPTGSSCTLLAACNGVDQCVGAFVLEDPRCEPSISEGDRCDFNCLGSLWCDLSQGPVGVCRALPTLGEDCSGARRCASSDLYCAPSRRCELRHSEGSLCRDEGCEQGTICTSTTSEPARCMRVDWCLPEF